MVLDNGPKLEGEVIKSKLKSEGTFLKFLQTMRDTLSPESKGKRIILIKDECHIATNNLDELYDYFETVINFSATPKLSRKQNPDVEITNIEAESCNLIKKVELGTAIMLGSFRETTIESITIPNDSSIFPSSSGSGGSN